MKVKIALIFSLLMFCFVGLVSAQTSIGCIEYSGDQRIYAFYTEADPGVIRFKPVEQLLEPTTPAEVATAVGALYSSAYQRIFAVYKKTDGSYVAHTAQMAQNQQVNISKTFGVVFEPTHNAFFAVILTDDDRLLAIKVN